MRKQDRIKKELESNKKEITQLESFRQTKQVKQFLRQLFAEQSFLKAQLNKIQKKKETSKISKEERQRRANKQRSEKMKRNWRFFQSIQDNYPVRLSVQEIRSAFSRHKKGLENDVPDVAWRNPSP